MAAEIKTNLHLEIAHLLFIDVVGYSKLLVNEQSELLQKLNAIVLQTEQVRAADAANQLIRLPTGDGMALVFRNHPEAAVECALEIATALKSHREIQVRMGVHSGPVNEVADLNQRANITGAGVNMAQRVMDCGDAGHILLSKRVADDLSQYRNWRPLLHDLGEVEVKHGQKISLVNLYSAELGNPVAPEKFQRVQQTTRGRRRVLAGLVVFAALIAGLVAWWTLARVSPGAAPVVTSNNAVPISTKSVAVLPLENLSDEKENAFFADGIQDDVLTSLAKIKDLKVISRTSVMSYRDKAARNLKQIGKELGVANVVEGSVRRVGNRVLVNVQLIDTATDQHIWAERYDRTLADSITLQGELSSEIATALRATLSPEEKARVESKPTDNPDAYVAYLRGREAQLRPEVSRENYLSAESFYKQAIALDPKFVLARARLSYVQAWFYALLEPTNAARLKEARANAEEAVRLDPHSAEAHIALAKCAQVTEERPLASREAKAAVQLLPNDSSIAMAAAMVHAILGEDEEAAAAYKRAAELGPREPKIFYNWAQLLRSTGRIDEAIAALERALALAPDSIYFRLSRTTAEISRSGDLVRAREILSGLPAGQDPDGRVTAAYCSLALLERNFPEAHRLLEAYRRDRLPAGPGGGFGPPEAKAESEGYVFLLAGDRARAAEFFRAVSERYEATVKENPLSASAHNDLAFIYAVTNRKEQALAEAARVTELETSQAVPPRQRNYLGIAQTYAFCGEPDRAFEALEQFLDLRIATYTVRDVQLSPMWDPLRDDPRFKKLLETKKL